MRVAVTTTEDSFPRWAAAFERRSLEAVALPCIEVVARQEAQTASKAATAVDVVVLTSPRTVDFVWPEGGMPPTDVAAVGPATAAKAEAAGGSVAWLGGGTGGDLVDLILGRVRGRRVLVLHGAASETGRYRRLESAGAIVSLIPVYDTVPRTPATTPVDAVAFGSPSAVEGWSRARSLDGLTAVAAIGPVTAAAITARGGRPVVAATPSPDALASVLAHEAIGA